MAVDNINPSHYKSTAGFECIDVMAEVTKDLQGMEAVETAQVLKYIWRWKQKNGIEDLKKARWYLVDLINRLENETKRDIGDCLCGTNSTISCTCSGYEQIAKGKENIQTTD